MATKLKGNESRREKDCTERARSGERARKIVTPGNRENGVQRDAEREMQEGGRTEIARRVEQEEDDMRAIRLSPLLFFWSGLPSGACIPDYHSVVPPHAGRFTYKFNKHISYLMYALSRECFDRPGPPSSASTRLLLASSCVLPRATPRLSLAYALVQPSECSSFTSFTFLALHF